MTDHTDNENLSRDDGGKGWLKSVTIETGRFVISWIAVTALVMMLNPCSEHERHFCPHGFWIPALTGFLAACFLTFIRVISRNRFAPLKDNHED